MSAHTLTVSKHPPSSISNRVSSAGLEVIRAAISGSGTRSLRGKEQLSSTRHFSDHAYSGIKGKSSRKENITAQRIHLLLQEFKSDFYEVDILRHHPVVPWLEDYIEEVDEIMGKDPWIHGIAEKSPALKKISRFQSCSSAVSKKPRLDELFVDLE